MIKNYLPINIHFIMGKDDIYFQIFYNIHTPLVGIYYVLWFLYIVVN